MRYFMIFLLFSLALGGCRLSISAKELALHAAADEPGYLSVEDPTLYEDTNNGDRNSVEPGPDSTD